MRVNFVSTLDGSAQDADGVSGSLGGDADHQAFAAMRGEADLVLVGAGTARTEDYGTLDDGVLALVTSSLDIPERLRTTGVAVVTTTRADAESVADLRAAGVEVLQYGSDNIDWPTMFEAFAERGWRRVLCEGGPSLAGVLLAHDLVDEWCVTYAGIAVAGDGSRIATSDEAVDRPMDLVHAVAVGNTLLTRWRRRR